MFANFEGLRRREERQELRRAQKRQLQNSSSFNQMKRPPDVDKRWRRRQRITSIPIYNRTLVSAEGSNISDGTSQCTESVAPSDIKVPIERPGDIHIINPVHVSRTNIEDTTCTETESIISSRQGESFPVRPPSMSTLTSTISSSTSSMPDKERGSSNNYERVWKEVAVDMPKSGSSVSESDLPGVMVAKSATGSGQRSRGSRSRSSGSKQSVATTSTAELELQHPLQQT